jgi:hypothetical protein
MRADKITETQEAVSSAIAQKSLEDIQVEFDNLKFNYERVNEQLQSLDIMLDNRGWTELLGTGLEDSGPRIDQIKTASEQLRELTSVNAHLKRGNLLRANYVLEGGPNYEGVDGGKGAGNKNIRSSIDDTINQREYFSKAAYKKRMKARYTDGHVLWIADDNTRKLKMIPFEKITGTLTNPEDGTEIWALRIMRQPKNPNAELEARWIFLDEFKDKQNANRIVFKSNPEPIEKNSRIFLEIANPTLGWRWGTPDALAAMAWIRMYREFLISGKKMSDAMAMLWGQYKNVQAGAQNASVQIGGAKQGAGGTAFGGGEYNIFNTAGKSYEFDAGRPILAAAATALEVSVVALASDPGAAGSSYGSAQTLDLPGRIAITAIRDEIAEMDVRVLKWLGAKNPVVWFDSLLDAEQIYRMLQAEQFYWANGLREAKEQKTEMDAVLGKPRSLTPAVPSGVMLQNNVNFPGTLSNDNQPGSGNSNAPQQVAPDQGKSNGTGGAGNLGNQRRDTISN